MGTLDRRSLLVVVGIAAAAAVAIALPVAAHGAHVSVDAQVSSDGTVKMELVSAVTTSYLVLHADDDGEFGEVVGHSSSINDVGIDDLTVSIADEHWTDIDDSRRLWAVLHYDADDDGTFDASSDPPIQRSDGSVPSDRFTIGKGTGSTYVLAERDHAQRTNESTVEVREVQLADDGYLVLRADENGTPGASVGHRALPAGTHRNVSVSIDEHYYHHRPAEFTLWAVLHESDGDDTFDDEDAAVMAGDSAIASRFSVERMDADATTEHEHDTATPTSSPTRTEARTSSATPTIASPSTTETASPTGRPTDSPSPTETQIGGEDRIGSPTDSPTRTTTTPGTTAPGQHGFGIAIVGVALLAILIAARRRTTG